MIFRVFTDSGITKKKNTQIDFVNELHAFCPFFKAYHVGKHRRGLMHVSYCISSHNFTYIIHIFVYAILIPSLQFSLHLKSKWLKNYSKSLPERTKSVLLFFFFDSCSPQYREEIDPDFQTSQPSYRRSYGTAKMTHPRFYMTVMESEKRCVYFDHPYISGNASLHAVHGDSYCQKLRTQWNRRLHLPDSS